PAQDAESLPLLPMLIAHHCSRTVHEPAARLERREEQLLLDTHVTQEAELETLVTGGGLGEVAALHGRRHRAEFLIQSIVVPAQVGGDTLEPALDGFPCVHGTLPVPTRR